LGNNIKGRVATLGKKNGDVIDELKKRGFATMSDSMYSNIVKGRYNYGMAPEVLEETKKILDEWEGQASAKA